MFDQPYNLVCVLGGSPAVITEMLYGFRKLAQGEGYFIPNEIYLLTTEAGLRYEELVKEQISKFLRCYKPELSLTPKQIDEQRYVNFIVPTDDDGEMIKDVSSEKEEALFDVACHNLILNLSNNSRYRTFASVAGGRKMMALSLVNAIQIAGSLMDKVFTVHIAPEIEEKFGFFFPIPFDKESKTHLVPELDRRTLQPKDEIGQLKLIDTSKIDFNISEKRVIKYGPNIREKLLPDAPNLNELYELIELSNYPNHIGLTIKLPSNGNYPITIFNIMESEAEGYSCNLDPGPYMMLRLLAKQTLTINDPDVEQLPCVFSKPRNPKRQTRKQEVDEKNQFEFRKDRVRWNYCYLLELLKITNKSRLENLKSWNQVQEDNYHISTDSTIDELAMSDLYEDLSFELERSGMGELLLIKGAEIAASEDDPEAELAANQKIAAQLDGEKQLFYYSPSNLTNLQNSLQHRFSKMLAEKLFPIIDKNHGSWVLPLEPKNIIIE